MAAWEATFTKLRAWQVAHEVALDLFRTADGFPRGRYFALCNQLQRASLSMPTNIAEGYARRRPRDKAYFYLVAKASGEECKSLLLFARDLGLLGERFDSHMARVDEVCRLTHGMIETVSSWQPSGR